MNDMSVVGPMLVIGFIVLSFVFARKLGRGLLRSFSNAGTLEQGVPASAVITSMGETGTTVNEHPVVEFGLRVTRDGAPAYDVTVKQMLPRLLVGQVRPGLAVGVKVMPGDPNDVAIDWDAPAAGGGGRRDAGGGDPTVPEGMFAGVGVTATVDSRAFLATAHPASAEIVHMSQTGMTAPDPRTGGAAEVFGFVVEVQRPGHPPYEAKLLQSVPAELEGRVGPGATVPVGISPADPSDVAIDWERYGATR